MRKFWWKILSFALLIYAFVAGFLIEVPDIGNLQHSIRNFFFHVPMWFGQFTLITISVVYSVLFLRKPFMRYDIYASEFARTGIVFGALGLITGAIWANYTWGAPWNNDPKQLGAAIALLIYLAYFVLRNSMTDIDKRGRVAAVRLRHRLRAALGCCNCWQSSKAPTLRSEGRPTRRPGSCSLKPAASCMPTAIAMSATPPS